MIKCWKKFDNTFENIKKSLNLVSDNINEILESNVVINSFKIDKDITYSIFVTNIISKSFEYVANKYVLEPYLSRKRDSKNDEGKSKENEDNEDTCSEENNEEKLEDNKANEDTRPDEMSSMSHEINELIQKYYDDLIDRYYSNN